MPGLASPDCCASAELIIEKILSDTNITEYIVFMVFPISPNPANTWHLVCWTGVVGGL
jgi:hypothetical protein